MATPASQECAFHTKKSEIVIQKPNIVCMVITHTSCLLLHMYMTVIFEKKFWQVIEPLAGGEEGGHKSFVHVFIIVFCWIPTLFTICDIPENIVAKSFKCF